MADVEGQWGRGGGLEGHRIALAADFHRDLSCLYASWELGGCVHDIAVMGGGVVVDRVVVNIEARRYYVVWSLRRVSRKADVRVLAGCKSASPALTGAPSKVPA